MFVDRSSAGRQLAEKLEKYASQDAVVLALPRGGVVVGWEIAKALKAPLDVIITRKIGAPGNPEYAIGAVGETGEAMLNEEVISLYGIPDSYVKSEISRQMSEIKRRIDMYCQARPRPRVEGNVAIVVDDGVATGYTMFAALKTARSMKPAKLVVAVPVGPPSIVPQLRALADEVVILLTPQFFQAVGMFYANFKQVSDQEVMEYLRMASEQTPTEQAPQCPDSTAPPV